MLFARGQAEERLHKRLWNIIKKMWKTGLKSHINWMANKNNNETTASEMFDKNQPHNNKCNNGAPTRWSMYPYNFVSFFILFISGCEIWVKFSMHAGCIHYAVDETPTRWRGAVAGGGATHTHACHYGVSLDFLHLWQMHCTHKAHTDTVAIFMISCICMRL